jgi:Chitin recognition protein
MIEVKRLVVATSGQRGWLVCFHLLISVLAMSWETSASSSQSPEDIKAFAGHSEPQVMPVPIVDIGTDYILGQLGIGSLGTGGRNDTSGQPHSRTLALSGPVQCSKNETCIDSSCCNNAGKCGFTDAHCAPENCVSNCNATAPCGINSDDHKTQCGLGLCCSFYGWCGWESVHCKDPEPQYGKVSVNLQDESS